MICSKCNEERNLLSNILDREVINWNILDMEDKFLLIMKNELADYEGGQFIHHIMTCDNNYNGNKAIRDGKYLAPPHASAWQRSPH